MARGNNRNNVKNPIKETVSMILESKGISYDTWLEEAYMKLIFENLELLNEGLALKKELEGNSGE
ncbi:hypothetical protein [Clostridium perfringens]|uniref:hypothetical protein n=1 Tax=Clostridium perfringens TaxID=1502 RepID=UPI00109442F9|nr:hypothetical protein [Clostridium perfringens]MDK0651566.1 hypothetical protein [Clostridium perfringens]MDM0627406.1 hypothetical protein [Clostridium perfringens]TGY43059.1 hypothetical protein E5346_13185 [Clostridium perfringens]